VASLSSGLNRLENGAASLDQISDGVDQYTGGVSELSAALNGAVAQLAADPTNAQALGAVQAIANQLSGAAAQGGTLASSTRSGVDGVQSGIGQSADGASRLAASSGALTEGAAAAAAGATELATGATTLADGLAAGAAQVPATTDGSATSAEVVAEPVAISVTRDNPLDTIGQAAASGLIPIALWIGALIVTLVSRPLPQRSLLSTASTPRVVGRRLGWVFLVTGSQAVLLTLLLHTALGISWSALGATLGFTLLTAFTFAALHTLLGAAGRAVTLLVSVLLLAVQLAAAGGALPAPVLADPFAALSQYLPIGWAQSGLLGILAGQGMTDAAGAAVALAGLALTSAVLVLPAVARRRRLAALGLIPNDAGLSANGAGLSANNAAQTA
jgi:putative membrane protein